MVPLRNGCADDNTCHDPQAAAVIVFSVQFRCRIEAQGLHRVRQTLGDISAQEALRCAQSVELEERFGFAFVLRWLSVLGIDYHSHAENRKEKTQPDETCPGRVSPVFIVLARDQLCGRLGYERSKSYLAHESRFMEKG